jgi:hypothetical protein
MGALRGKPGFLLFDAAQRRVHGGLGSGFWLVHREHMYQDEV